VLTGHVLKDPDYVSRYHRDTLSAEQADGAKHPIHGTFRNLPETVPAKKAAILEALDRKRRARNLPAL
jgi:hypothetical protein